MPCVCVCVDEVSPPTRLSSPALSSRRPILPTTPFADHPRPLAPPQPPRHGAPPPTTRPGSGSGARRGGGPWPSDGAPASPSVRPSVITDLSRPLSGKLRSYTALPRATGGPPPSPIPNERESVIVAGAPESEASEMRGKVGLRGTPRAVDLPS